MEIIEAARIDGLSEFKIFLTIFMPTMKSTYAAALTVTFMEQLPLAESYHDVRYITDDADVSGKSFRGLQY